MKYKLIMLEKILKEHINIKKMAKDLMTTGIDLSVNKKIIPAKADFFALKDDVNRIKRLPDGWFRDEFLSLLRRRKVEISPVELEKYVPRQSAEEYITSLSKKGYIYRMFYTFEWVTAFDYTQYNPALVEAFKIIGLKTDDWYWAEENLNGDPYPNDARIVGINDGTVGDDDKNDFNYVRPVRISRLKESNG